MIRRSAAFARPVVKTAVLALAVSAVLTVAPPALGHAASAAEARECAAGSGIKNKYVDCSTSTPSVLPDAVGKILRAFGVDGSAAIAGIKKVNGANVPNIPIKIAGTASVAGDGFTAAIGASADARATAEGAVSAAASLAVFDGDSTAKAEPFGAALAVSLGSFFSRAGEASAHAMPLGVALANSTEALTPAAATALFGWASGVSNNDATVDGASCVALYAQASGGGSSCTGLLLTLAKQTSAAAGAPTIWAIRDLFSLTTKPVVGKGVTDFVDFYGSFAGMPEDTSATLQAKIAPVFTRDFIRLEQYRDGTYLVRSDMPGLKPFLEWANPTPWTPAWNAADDPSATNAPTTRSARSVRSVRSLPDSAEPSTAPSAPDALAVEAEPGLLTETDSAAETAAGSPDPSPAATAAGATSEQPTGEEVTAPDAA